MNNRIGPESPEYLEALGSYIEHLENENVRLHKALAEAVLSPSFTTIKPPVRPTLTLVKSDDD